MAVDVEKIFRPIGHPYEPYPTRYMMLASGETLVTRQAVREQIPELLKHVAPLIYEPLASVPLRPHRGKLLTDPPTSTISRLPSRFPVLAWASSSWKVTSE